ncbi:MAG: T9SS type A sorting domain-containing protein [Saprospiraceae bacterium]|nr:T9SS type A sorting domain-containing protein [Saprospiraceae bacterium]
MRILLPPKSQDDPGSQGYFKFKIKPNANAILGSKIHNTAEIYFDYNLPVITNQVSHQLLKDIISVGLNPVDKFKDLVAIIPNPNSGIFSIKLHERYEHADLRILNQMGQTVFTQKGIKNNYIISKSLLPEGIYFIEISKHQLPKLNSKFIVIKNE